MKTRLCPMWIAVICLLPAATYAAERPTLVNVRATGLFADWEFSFLPDPNRAISTGLLYTIVGVEASFVSPNHWVLEAGGEALHALQDGGWAGVIRGGWWFDLHGTPSVDANTWFGGLTPFGGLRFGRFPYESGADGTRLHTETLALQAGAAYDLIRGGRSLGFNLRLFSASSVRLINRKVPSDWYYARTEPARGGIEAGLSIGISVPR